MTIEQVSENNKLIADFMGIPKCDRCPDCGNYKYGAGIYYAPELMLYHRDWNWIMPVVDKIRDFKQYRPNSKELFFMSDLSWSMHFSGYYNNAHVILTGSITECHNLKIPHTYTTHEMPQISITDKDSILATYKAIIKFIKWYNQKKTEHEK